jgi:hypothetical protein
VRFFFRVSSQDNWMIQLGPLGGYSVKWTVIGERGWYTTPLDKSDRFPLTPRFRQLLQEAR